MHFSPFLAATSRYSASTSAPFSPSRHAASYGAGSSIQWNACGLSSTDQLNNTRPILCGSLLVPLDYTDPKSAATKSLDVFKLPAVDDATKKDSVLLNFGGPGDNGVDTFQLIGAKLQG
jgi:hypothetical protein